MCRVGHCLKQKPRRQSSGQKVLSAIDAKLPPSRYAIEIAVEEKDSVDGGGVVF